MSKVEATIYFRYIGKFLFRSSIRSFSIRKKKKTILNYFVILIISKLLLITKNGNLEIFRKRIMLIFSVIIVLLPQKSRCNKREKIEKIIKMNLSKV